MATTIPFAYRATSMAFDDFISQDVADSLVEKHNQNLIQAQKELLQWHWKLGHCGFQQVQSLFRSSNQNSPIIVAKLTAASSCSVPICASCRIAHLTRRTSTSSSVSNNPAQLMALRRNDLTVGQTVSMDQHISTTPGRLPHTKVKESPALKYTGGTIFVDHCSKFMYIYNQVSLGAGETLVGKCSFESTLSSFGFTVLNYHGDNGIFASQAFKDDCRTKGQNISFSGAGAHHQNGMAECSIQTVIGWARTMLLHAAVHWPAAANIQLWPFALEHAVYLWNILPDTMTRLSPLELISGSHNPDYSHLRHLHVWGCPTIVLDPRLQDGKKLPKWSPRSRMGCFLGYSPCTLIYCEPCTQLADWLHQPTLPFGS